MTKQNCKTTDCNRTACKHGYCPKCVENNEHIARKVEELDRQEETIKAMVDNLANLVNNMSLDSNAVGQFVANAMFRQHPTLQQSIIRVLVIGLKQYGEIPFFDARNEAGVRWARKATEDENYFPLV